MKNSVPLFLVVLCVVQSLPINDKGDFPLVDDAAVKADRTKDEVLEKHDFLPKKKYTVGGVGQGTGGGSITKNEKQQSKSVPDIEKHAFGTTDLDAEATRQEYNQKVDVHFANLKSPETEKIPEKKKEEVSPP